MTHETLETPGPWLVRIAKVFEPLAAEILAAIGTPVATRLGPEYWLLGDTPAAALDVPRLARFIRWRLPVHHSWPCSPRRMDGFIEKAAQSLARKFGPSGPQTLLCGVLDPGSPDPYFRQLASNLRGRALQVLPPAAASAAEDQRPAEPTLFCMLGRTGLFAGMAAPRACGGFFPGGTRFIRQADGATVSRAGAKVSEALHQLRLHRQPPPAGAHWLDLGASPGGMSAELIAKGYRVTAIDRAPLDPRLKGLAGLTEIRRDVAAFVPPRGARYDAILCDMNGDARESMRQVGRLAAALASGGLVIFTLKTAGVAGLAEIDRLAAAVLTTASAAGLRLLAETHLTYNRQEFTWLLTTW
jgi:23S rRNA U2552 (ribose-2'-O)-methylase RlmE/FtsJ